MPMQNADTRLTHLAHLTTYMRYDVTHMGNPDGVLMSPCCPCGFRAVWGPRPALRWHPATGYAPPTVSPATHGKDTGNVGTAGEMWDEEDIGQFTLEQRLGNEGSWVLLVGATQEADSPPMDAQAAYFMTTQSDISTIEEELWEGQGPLTAAQGYGLGEATLPHEHRQVNINPATGQQQDPYEDERIAYRRNRAGELVRDETRTWADKSASEQARHDVAFRSGNWQGQTVSNWYDPGGPSGGGVGQWQHQGGAIFPSLRRWTSDSRNSGFSGGGGESGHGLLDTGGVNFPGGSEAASLPGLADNFNANQIWWVLYGNRSFRGIQACLDPGHGDPDRHGPDADGHNWRGLGVNDPNVAGVIPADATARGGYLPKITFWGGDVIGAQGTPTLDGDGNITGITMTDPGAAVITRLGHAPEAPSVSVSMPHHYNKFEATAKVETDKDLILAALDDIQTQNPVSDGADGYEDPIAQTFLVNGRAHPDGVFVQSVDVCFSSKPNFGVKTPVFLELRPTINGVPSAEKVIISKMLRPNGVIVADAQTTDFVSDPAQDAAYTLRPWEDPLDEDFQEAPARHPSLANALTYTRFRFKYPIYLEVGEYAIVIRSNDDNYRCWIADTEGAVVSPSGEHMSSTYANEHGGVFFRSSNGRSWTKNQKQDLMFRVNMCNFGGSVRAAETGSVRFGTGMMLTEEPEYDRLQLFMNSVIIPNRDQTKLEATFVTTNLNDDEVTLDSGTLFRDGREELGIRNMPERMKFMQDKTEPKDGSFRGTFSLSTTNPDISPVIDTRNCYITPLKNNVNGGGLSIGQEGANSIVIVAGGSGYTEDDQFTVSGGGSTSDAVFSVLNTDPANGPKSITEIQIVSAGSNFHANNATDPIIVTQSGGASGTGARFEVPAEEGILGGNSLVRYVTRNVDLAPGMSARAIKVFLTAQQPFGSHIHVYYKALAEEDSEPMNQKKWKLFNRTRPDLDYFSRGDESSFIGAGLPSGGLNEYEFDTDELISYETNDGQTYDSFRSFTIKIVLFAENPARVPIVKDFRAIAVY